MNTKLSHAQQNVIKAFRKDADPLFNIIAYEAALNGLHERDTGYAGVCFTQPTSHERGYWMVLKFISENSNGITRRELFLHYRTRISGVIARLRDGKLIAKSNETFYITELGKAYLEVSKMLLKKRKTVFDRTYFDTVDCKKVYEINGVQVPYETWLKACRHV